MMTVFLFIIKYFCGSLYFRENLNQLGFSWELPTHTRRKKKGDVELVDGAEAVPTDVVVNSEEKTDQEVLVEILPAVTSGGGSSKWPHEVHF